MADLDIIIERFETQQKMISRLISKIDYLEKVITNQKEWITPEQAAEITHRTVKYLVDFKDSLGLIYTQQVKRGKILFKTSSIMEFMERNSNHKN